MTTQQERNEISAANTAARADHNRRNEMAPTRNETIDRLTHISDSIQAHVISDNTFRSIHATAVLSDVASVIKRLEDWTDFKFGQYKVELLVSITQNATSRLESCLNSSYSSADQQFADTAKAWAAIDTANAYGRLLTDQYADISWRDR